MEKTLISERTSHASHGLISRQQTNNVEDNSTETQTEDDNNCTQALIPVSLTLVALCYPVLWSVFFRSIEVLVDVVLDAPFDTIGRCCCVMWAWMSSVFVEAV